MDVWKHGYTEYTDMWRYRWIDVGQKKCTGYRSFAFFLQDTEGQKEIKFEWQRKYNAPREA